METTSDARKKKASTRRYHVVRVILFVTACAAAVIGMLMLTMASDKQIRSETVTSEVARAEAQANVLLIMGYNDADVLTPLARKGVVDIMNDSGVVVDVEYMDAINCPKGSEAYKSWEKTLTEKLGEEMPYHIIMCCDDEALTFVEDHYDTLFPNMPVVFYNINDFDHAEAITKAGYATGLVEQGNVPKIVDLSRQLRPNATKFVAVVDDTPSGKGDRVQFEKAVASTGMEAEYLDASKLSRDKLAQRLGSVGDDSIVFFLDAFNDADGNTYTRDVSARFVADSASQPVFGIATGGVGEGLVGASFTDPEADGQSAADTAITVLNGTSPGTIDLVTEGIDGFAFDAAVMEKYGISADLLPSNVVMINRSAFNLDSVKGMLPAIGLLLLAIVLILIFALMGYRHSLANTREIIAQSNDLRHRYYHDPLTDKANTQWFKEFMANPETANSILALVEVDFVDFGDVNDSYGQAAGDAVLREFAERFDSIENKEFLVRSTGSGFRLGFGNVVEPNGPELQAIGEILAQAVVIDDAEIEVDAHIGVSNRRDTLTVDEMVIGVDLAVRDSKKDGTANTAVFYEERMKHEMEEKIGVTAILKQSIKDESFVVLYQPQVSLKTDDVSGYEALVRLKGDAYYPGQFIPVAEMSGLVIDVDRIVTKKVVQQLAEWKRNGERLAPVSINYSAVQLKDVGYVDFLIDLLRQYDVDPAYVKIEITESLLLGDEGGAENLFARLGEAGIPVALDDFGTGYTSLSSVATMPADIVKIDKSLVDEYAVPGKERFLDNLVRLVHDLDKAVIVEGVETADQLQIFRRLGCDIVQGYYFSRPVPPEEAAHFVPFPDKDEKPAEAAKPAETAKPAAAAKAAEPAKAVEPAKAEQPVKVAQSAEKAQTAQPAKSAKATAAERAKKRQVAQESQAAQVAQELQAVQAAQVAQVTQELQELLAPLDSQESLKPRDLQELISPQEPIKPMEPIESQELDEPQESEEPKEPKEARELIAPQEPIKPLEPTEPVGYQEPRGPVGPQEPRPQESRTTHETPRIVAFAGQQADPSLFRREH